MNDHQHTWKTIWNSTADGMVVGNGVKCTDCGVTKWTGRKPPVWSEEDVCQGT